MRRSIGKLLLAFILLSSCSGGEGNGTTVLPEGIQTLSGVVLPAELSLVRRGTHVLVRDGADISYLESPVVSLRKYEHASVTLRGTLEQNISPTLLPVLVVDSVVSVQSTTREWGIRKINLSLTTPDTWQQRNAEGQVQFFVQGTDQPILTLDEQEFSGELPFGQSIVVDGNPAVRIENEQSGNQAVFVLRGKTIVTLLFTPREAVDPQILREEWSVVLSSIRFNVLAPPLEESVAQTGSLTGTPCGGLASVLCPQGFYCEVLDTQEDQGVCRPLAVSGGVL